MSVREFYGVLGNEYMIANLDFNECCVFDDFGGFKRDKGVIGSCSIVKKVNVLSVLHDNYSNDCEIYFAGKSIRVDQKGLVVFNVLRQQFENYIGTPFRYSRYIDGTKVSQFLLVYEDGVLSNSMIKVALSNKYIAVKGDWVGLN